jgi:hypothetical protein
LDIQWEKFAKKGETRRSPRNAIWPLFAPHAVSLLQRAELLYIDGNPIAGLKATWKMNKLWLAGAEFDGAARGFEE